MRKMINSTVLGLVALLLLSMPAGATWGWSEGDPIVRLNGTQVQILVAVPDTYVPLVNGPIDVKVGTPTGVTRQLLFTDSGFNGYGETVKFTDLYGAGAADGSFATTVRVRVPVNGAQLGAGELVPVKLTVITANGQTLVGYGNHNSTQISLTISGTK